ncbi:high-affinity branched-chain amino acid ABC transporter system permease protein LivM [Gottschalkia acidurici 9a]|uniref:High-affinity branched-chain amino acid ABC transporter system permease protein LivM n=1 Tax=Gottschalkia acidurici (strain ATCC 7906 / DSM 604 / BCRC 14475 / CIP 104303 / KCTC 5404 / NCIMB 10678 / 9a) TaxID=1128398 RepID=K0AZH5_GOTA9|nr:branched-chain amino acid ABC transporter permease [Gottschalkia acidurici]AFS78187.1 high-affinity branched-chain amino acid ABC transporter system permease protein LivM [Gottschalkia acidurici 9a]
MNINKRVKGYIINGIGIVLLYILLVNLINGGQIDRYQQGIIIMIGINIILAVSLNLTTGFLGQLALGHAGFMGIGAYTAAIATMNMNIQSDTLQLVVSMIIGGIIAAVFGIIIGVPALRLEGDYLAIITLGFGEMIRVIINNLEITGGAKGLKGILPLTNFSHVYWVTIITVVLMFSLMRSRHGRSIISVRENEIAANAVGVPTAFYKIFGFVLSAFFAGIAGGLYAHYMSVLSPSKFGFMYSIEILVIVVLGGMGSITGSIIAAILLTLLPEALREFSTYRLLIYSILLIVMMLFKPSGLFGTSEFSIHNLIIRKKKMQSQTRRLKE